MVGEAPGADDDRAGTAFAGAAGLLLDRMLGSAGLDRMQLLLTHLVPWRPPGGRAPNEAEIQACLPFLLRLLSIVRPSGVVLLGTGPARALLRTTEGVRRIRGRWLPLALPGHDAMMALPMLGFDQWLRSPAGKRDTWADLLLLQAGPPAPAT